MGRLRVGVIGTGNPAQGASRMGFAMAYQHANAYAKFDNCQLVACADIKAESAETFVEKCQVPIYLSITSGNASARRSRPSYDLCSATSAAQMVIDAVEAGVRAIHSEKPMANA